MPGLPSSSPGRRVPSAAWGCGLILAAVLVAYLPALRAGLIWNDSDYVTRPDLRSLHGLARIWFDLGATEQYYPVLHSAFWLEHRWWGGSALGYHLVNVLWHAAAACLLVAVLRRLAVPGAWLAGLIFALHPVEVESVAWISEQKNTLSLVCYLGAALAYLRFDATRRARWYALGLLLFLLALLSKSVTATLPAALLVIFWWQRGRLSWRREVGPLAPWLAVGAVSGLFSAWVERTYVGAQGSHFGLNGLERTLVAARAVWFYLGKLFWPENLTFIYPRWEVSASVPWPYLAPLGLLALAAGLWLIRRRSRAPLAALLFFVGSLFPILGFFNIYAFVFSYVADHWQYLASLGVITLAAAGLAGLPPRVARLAAGVLAVVLGTLTWRQCRMYRDLETLYRTTLDRNPDTWMAQSNYATLLNQQGRRDEAIRHYAAAIRLAPTYPEIHYNLADVLAQAGRSREAVAEYEAALRLSPDYAAAHSNLGTALMALGDPSAAAPHFEAALRLRPDIFQARYGLGFAYEEAGRLPEAIAQYAAAVRLAPGDPAARFRLASALGNAGRLPEAVAEYRQALRLKPDDPDFHYNLGMALRALGRTQEAAGELESASRLAAAAPR
jgi:tetratricopeptide (TPR) repeat protein